MTQLPPRSASSTDPTKRLVWIAALVYGMGLAMALLLPDDFRTMPDGLVRVVRFVEAYVPMIGRVTAYRHPHPEKLRAMLAGYWLLVPVLLVACRDVTRVLAGPPEGLADREPLFVLLRFTLTAAFLGLAVFFIWYWPNLLFARGAPLSRPVVSADTRAYLFRTTFAVVLYAPLWMGMFVWVVDGIRMEAVSLVTYFKEGQFA